MLRIKLGLAIAVFSAGAAFCNPVEVSADNLRKLAFDVMAAGNPAQALAMTDALLARDPTDAQAHILRAQALRELGKLPQAQAAAKSAWRLATDDKAKFGAAMVMAQALSSEGRRTSAQLWLRRAAGVAPNDQSKALARRDFGYVKSRNPLILKFDFSISPSSNVNNGSTANSYSLPFLPEKIPVTGDSAALAGGEASFGMTGVYRLLPTETGMTEFRFSAQQRTVWLSAAGKSQAAAAPPGSRIAKGSDYNFASVDFGAKHKFRAAGAKATYDFGATLGHNWYGGEDLSNYLRLNFGVERALSNQTGGMFGLSYERQLRLDEAIRSATILGMTLGVARQLPNGDNLQLTLSQRQTASDSPGIRNDASSLRLGWVKDQPIAGVGLSAGLTVDWKSYPDSPYVTTGARQDHRVGVDLSFAFEKIDYMGFSPVVDLRASRNQSNVGLFESQDIGISLGVKSSF